MPEFLTPRRETTTIAGEVQLNAAGFTVKGRGRDNNQDAWRTGCDGRVLAVADGVGGGVCGELASELAIDTLLHELAEFDAHESELGPDDRMMVAFSAAAASIEFSAAARDCTCMGTTAVCAALNGSELTIGWAGDSRAFLLRHGKVRLLTHDHTLAQKLADVGAIPDEAVSTHPYRNNLWNFLGVGDATGMPDTVTIPLQPGDRILLATDGATGPLTDEDLLRDVMSSSPSPNVATRRLARSAVDAGSRDDATCVVAFVEEA